MSGRNVLATRLPDAAEAPAPVAMTARPPGKARTLTSRLLGFGLLPIIATIGSLALVPLVTRTAGPVGWGAIATGQAVGAVGATVVQFGWAVLGPPKVTALDERAARGVYFTSAIMRIAVFVVTVPVLALVVGAVVPPAWRLIAVALCVAVTLSGLSSAWYFIGTGRPRGLLLLEVGPRLIGTATSVVLLLCGAGIGAYGCVALITEVVIAAVVCIRVARPDRGLREHVREAARAMRDQWGLALSALLALGYQRAAVPLVAGANLAAAPLYATSDRAQAYARLPLGPVVQAAQKWVYDGLGTGATRDEFARRARLATGATALTSALLAAVVLIALPPASSFFFGAALELGPNLALPIAVSVVAIGASLGLTSFALIPLGRVGVVTWSGVIASVISAPLIWFVAGPAGAVGALWVVTAAETGVAVAQALVAFNDLRRRDRRAPSMR